MTEDLMLLERSLTSDEENTLLHQWHFVRVTGLTEILPSGEKRIIGESLTADEKGVWNHKNGIVVVTTAAGEVWLTTYRQDFMALGCSDQFFAQIRDLLIPHLDLKGLGGRVPCADGGSISVHQLLDRVGYWKASPFRYDTTAVRSS